jgi:dihydroxyacid dehydratase/phosphogluconate dehydratase
MDDKLNRQSRAMTEGVARTPNRAMLRAVGFQDEDFEKPIVGIASAGSEVTPCNVHLDDLALIAKHALTEAGSVPLKFNTFVVTDGKAMGHEGMKCSLISRDVIADVIELVIRGHQMDGILGIGGCDKTIPGTVMALGGSTNAVLHLLALAREAGISLIIDDFNSFSDSTPILCDMKPAGRYVMNDLYRVGGVQAVMKLLSRLYWMEGFRGVTAWSSDMRGPGGGPGCGRCSPLRQLLPVPAFNMTWHS